MSGRSAALLFYLFLLTTCQSREVSPAISGAEYFPLSVGTYWIYDVTETNISQVNGQTNDIYQLMLSVTDTVHMSGEILFKVVRSRRPDASAGWSVVDTWSFRKNDLRAVIQEGNISYVVMTFPMTEGKTWDGNALNNLGGIDKCSDGTRHCDNYSSIQLMKRFDGTGIAYDDTVTVLESNEDDKTTGKDIRKSVYGRAVGLVYHEETVLEYCTQYDSCIGKQIVDSGHILKQTITSYGSL
ncbi:MAG: hypothetical protein JST46_17015 [Bacteroidetes bacterium]|nr:hypothetical protein [Bacteroidota bacterium]